MLRIKHAYWCACASTLRYVVSMHCLLFFTSFFFKTLFNFQILFLTLWTAAHCSTLLCFALFAVHLCNVNRAHREELLFRLHSHKQLARMQMTTAAGMTVAVATAICGCTRSHWLPVAIVAGCTLCVSSSHVHTAGHRCHSCYCHWHQVYNALRCIESLKCTGLSSHI